MIKLKQISIAFLACGIAGCHLTDSHYVKPEVNAPLDWNSGQSNSNAVAMADMAWWKQFNDPVLNNMIEQALANNNNIQVAIGNIEQAQAQLEKAQRAWVPTASVMGGGFTGESFNQSLTPNTTSSSATPNMDFHGAFVGFVPSYSLNVFQILKNQEMAKANLKIQKAAKNAVCLTVISQVAGGYFSLLGLKRQLELENKMVQDAIEIRKYTLIQIAQGSASYVDLDRIDQVLYMLSARTPSINGSIVQTQNALQVLMNKNPSTLITHNSFEHIKTDGRIPVNLPSEVLKNRPDIQVSEYAMEASHVKIDLAMSQFFPNILLTSPIARGSFDLNNLFSGSTDFWATQVISSVPVLDLGIYADIKASKASYYSAYYSYIQNVRNAFAQVDDGLSAYESANNVFKRQQKALNAAKNLYQSSVVKYKNGSGSYSGTLNYQLNVLNAELGLNQAKMNQLDSIVNLYQVLGGGYRAEKQLVKKQTIDY